MFFGSLNYGPYLKERIRSPVRPEGAGVFHLDLDISYSPLAPIIVRRYERILKEVEQMVPAFDQPVSHSSEVLFRFVGPFFYQPVKPFEPWLLVYPVSWTGVSLVYSLTQKFFDPLGPVPPLEQAQIKENCSMYCNFLAKILELWQKKFKFTAKRTFCLKPYNNNLYYNYEKSPIYYLWSVGSHGHDRQ